MRVRRRWAAAAVAGVLAVSAAAGCGGDDAPAGDAATTAAPTPATTVGTTPETTAATTAATVPAPEPVTIWFAGVDGGLRTERRPVAVGADRLRAALDALAGGPDDPSLIPALPPGTRILGAVADGTVAVVDLSGEFERGYPPGGAAAELAVMGPLVRTAAAASGAPRVRVLVEGRTPAPTGSQFDFSRPFAPGDLPAP